MKTALIALACLIAVPALAADPIKTTSRREASKAVVQYLRAGHGSFAGAYCIENKCYVYRENIKP